MRIFHLSPRVCPDLATLPPQGAIEKLAKEDPRRARTGQVLDDRIAAKRSELRKGKGSKKAKSEAAAATTVADPAEDKDGGGDGSGEKQENAAAASGDSMDEDQDGVGGGDGQGADAAEGEDGAGEDGDDNDDDDDDDLEEEEAQEGLEEDNLRELLAGGRGKVCILVAHVSVWPVAVFFGCARMRVECSEKWQVTTTCRFFLFPCRSVRQARCRDDKCDKMVVTKMCAAMQQLSETYLPTIVRYNSFGLPFSNKVAFRAFLLLFPAVDSTSSAFLHAPDYIIAAK